jgi:hypothetical protein
LDIFKLKSSFAVELKPVLDIADEKGADRFVSLVKSTGNEISFNKENSTVFAPSNEAMEKYQHRLSLVSKDCVYKPVGVFWTLV